MRWKYITRPDVHLSDQFDPRRSRRLAANERSMEPLWLLEAVDTASQSSRRTMKGDDRRGGGFVRSPPTSQNRAALEELVRAREESHGSDDSPCLLWTLPMAQWRLTDTDALGALHSPSEKVRRVKRVVATRCREQRRRPEVGPDPAPVVERPLDTRNQ